MDANLIIIMVQTTLSSKGQIVIPQEIREDLGWKEGIKLNIVETPDGILVIKIPKNPLRALEGIGKNLPISSADVRKMRQEDEEHDRREYSN